MEHPKYQLLAIVSGILTILAFSHIVYKVYITQQTEHLTYTWAILILIAQSLLIIYGIINNSYGIYLPASIIIFGMLYILHIKIKYSINNIETQLKYKNIII